MNDQHAPSSLAASLGDSLGSSTAALADARDAARGQDVPTLTKAELAEMLFEQVGLNKRESKDMVEAFFDVIREALEQGDSVKLSGFGNFQLRDKPQRPGRNPKTGEIIPITARRVVTFHASQKLKALVEQRAEPMPVSAA
ncbi:integration host factor subunit alpha [Ralstonia solanacearum]|uniref:Integration host factor subunit alpha n=1 Tax=Ralstonia solanacearum (strain Po82) TaxID=1031711 RepID=F6G1F3_RALS8|nr:integration host factor subunit alpha [Ralstonia solanacearum]AEG68957.1 integration host factor alpha-subunit (ihf-alpha) protein [Ralstonia solanacearum Po82]AMP70688.1 integration host factor subunit alpha [Ralstonia solanacearum]AMP72967.1 integration host factor subunit alpha [Ralstonia solanacearum]AYB60535.1 integration host factor subunit alpha [Ralstonia solanacearum]EUJ14997.1 integration host factor subunit alpha [Ralstonia solanacearum P673]